MKPPERFTTSAPLIPGTIYQLQQGDVKRVVTKGSAERKGLTGHWTILKQFKNEVQNDRTENR